MRIGIDARALGWEGLGRYGKALLTNLTKLPSNHTYVIFTPKAYAKEVASLPKTRVVPVTDSYYSIREQTVFLASLLSENVDLMHFLHFNAPMLYRRPSVVTIHDLTRFFFPAQKRSGPLFQWVYEEVFRSVVLHADQIIALSQHTRADLIRFFPDVSDRTVVIPAGIDHGHFSPATENTIPADLKSFGIHSPYLLYVGAWIGHKNIKRLLAAFQILKNRGYKGTLVITGKGRPHHEDVPRHVQSFDLQDSVILPGFIPEHVLPDLYRHAEVFVFPSLYEGFGFPPLEAMSSGTPVVCSRVASLPEFCRDAAYYVDPLSEEDIARGIERVLSDHDLRAELVHKGKIRVQQYRWDTCAEKTLAVYENFAVRKNKE